MLVYLARSLSGCAPGPEVAGWEEGYLAEVLLRLRQVLQMCNINFKMMAYLIYVVKWFRLSLNKPFILYYTQTHVGYHKYFFGKLFLGIGNTLFKSL